MSEQQNISTSRFVKRYLNERQIKSFRLMYNSSEYDLSQIRVRFQISDSVVNQLAHELGCKVRKGRS